MPCLCLPRDTSAVISGVSLFASCSRSVYFIPVVHSTLTPAVLLLPSASLSVKVPYPISTVGVFRAHIGPLGGSHQHPPVPSVPRSVAKKDSILVSFVIPHPCFRSHSLPSPFAVRCRGCRPYLALSCRGDVHHRSIVVRYTGAQAHIITPPNWSIYDTAPSHNSECMWSSSGLPFLRRNRVSASHCCRPNGGSHV